MVNAGLMVTPEAAVQELGEVYAQKLNTALTDSTSVVFDLIGKHKIACGAARKGSVHLAYRETDEPMLRAQPKQMKSLGCDVEFVEAAQSRQIIGSQAVFGGLVDHRDGTLNPVSYARGLAMTAQNAGARVFCGSAVTSVDRKPETWRFV